MQPATRRHPKSKRQSNPEPKASASLHSPTFASRQMSTTLDRQMATDEMPESDSYFSKLKWLGLRHSSYSGRNAGMGVPLTGTSWLNRPYYVGGDIGTVWLTRPINSDLTNDIDMFGGVFAGCDWDYYWGTELVDQSGDARNHQRTNARDADRGDRLMEETVSLMYYPWGDSLFRPYWRVGIGATEIDYPTDDGLRRDETLWTIPDRHRPEISVPPLSGRAGRVHRPARARQRRRRHATRSHTHLRPRMALRRTPALLLALEPQPPHLVGFSLAA